MSPSWGEASVPRRQIQIIHVSKQAQIFETAESRANRSSEFGNQHLLRLGYIVKCFFSFGASGVRAI